MQATSYSHANSLKNAGDGYKKNLNWSYPLAGLWEEHLIGWPKENPKKVYGKLWNISPAILMWKIWKERNHRIFSDHYLLVIDLLSKIEVAIMEVMNSDLRKRPKEEGSFSD